MRTLIVRVSLLAGCSLFLVGCASRPLPKFEKPLARAAVMNVRTTAYTHTEDDHVQYANRNALGGTLQCGPIHSAAADWSRWPAGSIFRIRETGEIYQVDDYGWALAGTNTIDLYKPSRRAMNSWGVRRVTIENLRWGDPRRSLSVLRPRGRYRHIKRMIDQLEDRMPSWQSSEAAPQLASVEPAAPPPGPAAAPGAQPLLVPISTTATPAVARATRVSTVPRAQPVLAPSPAAPQRTAQTGRTTTTTVNGNTVAREAFLNSMR